MDADGLGGGDGKAEGEDVAACDGDGTTTGGGALVPGWLAADDTLGDTLAAPAFAVTAALAAGWSGSSACCSWPAPGGGPARRST